MNAAPVLQPSYLLALHAPDGLFSLRVNLLFAALVALALVSAARLLARRGEHRLPPVMGIMAAFIFAAQMANFPVAAGVSGHLLGGTLAAILLGPWAATLIMGVVIFFQALLGDGGLTALGPNIFNMGIVGTFGGYLIFLAVRAGSQQPSRVVAAGAFAAWCAVSLASVAISIQLALSGTAGLQRVLPAMLGIHMLIGVGEALITAAALAFVLKTRPDLVYGLSSSRAPVCGSITRFGLAASVLACLALGLAAGPVPAYLSAPDGFEYVGRQQGFLPEEFEAPESETPESEPTELSVAATSLAGGLGTLAMFAGSLLVGHVFTRRSRLERALEGSTSTTNHEHRSRHARAASDSD